MSQVPNFSQSIPSSINDNTSSLTTTLHSITYTLPSTLKMSEESDERETKPFKFVTGKISQMATQCESRLLTLV